MSSIFTSIASASLPAKVAVVAVASAGSVAAGAPVVATIANAAAHVAPAATTTSAPGDDVVVTSVVESTTTTQQGPTSTTLVTTTSTPTQTQTTTTTTEAPPPEALQLWCDWVQDGDAAVVVCEWTASERESFVGYAVLRDGARVAVIDERTSPEQSGVRWVDTDPPSGGALYAIHVIDSQDNVTGATNTVIVGSTPTTTTTEPEPVPEPEPTTTTTAKPDEEHEDEAPWESIGLWCGRSGNAGEPGVVCEFGLSERDDFGSYVLKRNGEIIWQYASRTIPGRPWPDIRHVDNAAPAGAVSYSAYILNSAGEWVGGSGKITLESTVGEDQEEDDEEEESDWESLGLGCARTDNAESPTIVCEFTPSQSAGFAFYVLKRNGEPIAESATRENGHLFDYAAPGESVTYAVYILDAENNWIGGSATVTVAATD